MKKLRMRIGSIALSLTMALSLLPVTAFAVRADGSNSYETPDEIAVTGEEDQANSLVTNGDSEQTITLTQFVDAVIDGNGTYDGQGVVVEITPASGCGKNHQDHPAFVKGSTPERIQFYSGTAYAQYQRFAGEQDIDISNVTFRLVPPEDEILVCGAWNNQTIAEPDKLDAELQLNNTGSVSFTDCVFENVAVSPIGSKSSVSFADCDFSGLAQYAIKDVNAS